LKISIVLKKSVCELVHIWIVKFAQKVRLR